MHKFVAISNCVVGTGENRLTELFEPNAKRPATTVCATETALAWLAEHRDP